MRTGAAAYRLLALFVVTGLGAFALTRDPIHAQNASTTSTSQTVDFGREIQPILASRCYACHGPRNSSKGLRLDVRAGAMQGGESGPPRLTYKCQGRAFGLTDVEGEVVKEL